MSDLARYIGYGLAAITTTVFNSDSVFSRVLVTNFKVEILLASILGCAAIVFDYLQYLFGYMNAKIADKNLKPMEHSSAAEVSAFKIYNSKSLLYRARFWCFCLKHASVAIGAGMFIYILARDLIY